MISDLPNFDIENELKFKLIAGIDEAGRGPLCGPVIAAAVIIPEKIQFSILNPQFSIKITDSKKLSAKQRVAAFDWILANCYVGIGECSPAEIDEYNILQATMIAMKRAVAALPTSPEFVLVDGNRLPDGVNGKPVVKGDSKSLSIAAASIIAKVTRDRIMEKLHDEFPEYNWQKNAGYPTASHLHAIKNYGINEHYRKSFSPIKDMI